MVQITEEAAKVKVCEVHTFTAFELRSRLHEVPFRLMRHEHNGDDGSATDWHCGVRRVEVIYTIRHCTTCGMIHMNEVRYPRMEGDEA